MSKEKIFKIIYDASVLIGISSGFGYFVNMNDPSTSVIDYLKWVAILSGSIYLKDYMQREEILKKIDSLNSKKDTTLGAIASKNLNSKKAKNLDLKSKRIINLANPVGDKDAVNKSYADNKVSKTGDKMTGDLDMSGNEIKNIKEATSSDATFAANVNYVNRTVESIIRREITKMGKYVDETVKKVFYKGYLKHNNDSFIRFFANGTESHTRYTRQSDPSDFIVNDNDEEKIIIKNPGVYSISLIDGLKTSGDDDNGTVQFILNPAPFLKLSDNINITVPNSSKGFKTYNFISVIDIYENTKLSIQTSDARTVFDGLGSGYKKFGMILINKID